MARVKWLTLCLLCLQLFLASGQDTSGVDVTLTLTSTEGTLRTRVGCRVSVSCSGVGVELVWRRFGNRMPLNTTATRNETTGTIQANIVFDPVDVTDRGSYTCEIQRDFSENPAFTSMNVLIFVDREPIKIQLQNTNFDISTYIIGELASIACPVSTCHDNVTVKLLKDDDVIQDGILTGDILGRVYNFNLEVTESIVGTYTCKADFNGDTDMADFNITGTPRPDSSVPIPTSVTATVLPTGTPTIPTKEPDTGFSIVAQLPLITVLLLISIVMLLL